MSGDWPVVAPEGPWVEPPRPVTVGIVVTAHNVAPFLPAALASVFAQTRLPDEVVVCDDASEDDVAAAVAPFADRVRLVRRVVRGGEGAAKNTAMAALTSDLAVILDGDDEMAPQRVEALAWLAERRPDLHLMTTTWEDFGPGAAEVESDWSLDRHFPVEDQRSEILRWNFLPAPAIRRLPFLEAGGFDETLRYGPDWECYVRMFLHGAAAGLVPLPLYRYRRWSGQQTADTERVLAGRERVAELIAANPGLGEHDQEIAARTLADAAFAHWAWRMRHRRAVPAEARRLLRGGSLSPRRRAVLHLAARWPGPATRLLLRQAGG
ncbi:glycosyltransferase family A protein [Geodermatophilus sp. SYSU D01062]